VANSDPELKPTKSQIAQATASFVAPAIVVFLWFTFLIGYNMTLDRITVASGLVVQMNAFLTAGFLVGVFWYLKVIHEAIGPKLPYVLVYMVGSPFVGFTSSSFLAITCALTGNIGYLALAFYATMYSVLIVVQAWIILQRIINLMPSRANPTVVNGFPGQSKS
jgi:hypothetical protein